MLSSEFNKIIYDQFEVTKWAGLFWVKWIEIERAADNSIQKIKISVLKI